MQKTVSVVIPTYNYGRFIDEAIRSVLDQTHPAAEIIVVDDGSTDDTSDVVRQFGSCVKYIRQENMGVCSARNRGVLASRGDLIAFMDADDTWEPKKLELQSARFDDGVGLVHCGMREFDGETGETISLHLEGGEDRVWENLLLWEEPVIVGPGGTAMVSRNAFDDVGGFDVRMKVGEDWDLCYRVARHYGVRFVTEPLVNYRNHRNAAHLNVEEMERGMLLFLEKAFTTDDPEVLRLRPRAMGNYHRVMAGSYFQSGMIGKFTTHTFRSIISSPANLGYFLRYPFRRVA